MFKFYKQNKRKKLFARAGHTLSYKNKEYCVESEALKLTSFSENIVYTSKSVLLDDEYNFTIDEPYIMVDIGFNIGITSLKFAQDKNIVKIYGYEPFPPTYNNAMLNLSHNPQLAKKIELHNYGLGDADKELDIAYDKNRIGQMSTIVDRFAQESKNIEQVKIKNAAVELAPILSECKEKVFLKIDCEGAEFEILPVLDAAGLLKYVDIIIMEWHFKYPDEIIEILQRNNFFCFVNQEVFNTVGMLRAIKQMRVSQE